MTVALGMTAPLGSVTVPVILPVMVWASVVPVVINAMRSSRLQHSALLLGEGLNSHI
jgi:hypothetical protein